MVNFSCPTRTLWNRCSNRVYSEYRPIDGAAGSHLSVWPQKRFSSFGLRHAFGLRSSAVTTHLPGSFRNRIPLNRFCSLTTTTIMSNLKEVKREDHRLPLDVKPTHYDITIKTDLEKLIFEGSVKIDLEILKETSTIVFNSSGLNLRDIVVHSEALKTEQKISAESHDSVSERTTVQFPVALNSGSKAQLRANFDAPLTGSMMGYYYSTWEQDGKKSYYTLTQFESTAARRAFPCWDEPLLKATYTIHMVSRANTVNLSNMPVTSEEKINNGDWKITHFEKTPLVSSYLIAFANGVFDFLEDSYTSAISGKTKPLRIYATADHIHQAKYALDVKKKVLPLYEKMFEIEYPLPKLDTLIANDFDAGAMENWGLITGRTSVFCLDPQKFSVAVQKRVATVQSHEVAHMWFGNITTMAWWDNLLPGFATLMGEVMGRLYPEWKVYSEFITEHLNQALALDAKLSSHPIEVECPDANQINQIFDSLSYSKAGSVLRMLLAFVGEERFLKGVSIYLKKHLYANSVTKNLWDGIGEATKLDVATMMENWVSKMGFPVLTVTEANDGIRVRQDRFLETGPAKEQDNQTLWHVPLTLVQTGPDGKAKQDNSILMKEREVSIKLDTSKPFKLNADTTGVYRVLYSPDRLAKIAAEAAKGDSVFSLGDRIGLVHDSFALSTAGFAKVSDALVLVEALRGEKEYLVWQGIREKVSQLASIWSEDKNTHQLLNAFRRYLYGPLVEQLGFEYHDKDSADTKQLRTLALQGASVAGEQSVITEFKKRFQAYLDTGDDSSIPPDLERSIYICVNTNGGRTEYDAMKKIYAKPRTPSSKTAAIAGMCWARDPALIEETLKFIFDGAREQDIFYFMSGLSQNLVSRRRLAHWTKENYDEIYKRFSGNTQLSRIISSSFDHLTAEKDAQDVEEFFKVKDISKYDLGLKQTLDTIRANSSIIQRSTGDLVNWLESWRERSKL
ncbi:hypothetical protein BD410DRAFT_782728 [Rickenella mellea]|uniref:Aminopeptidase n=1 Tax=Rickenella mellea TaxID=50990 RepID=A0A4Y7QJR4_9AGAM|nr:hypothetical protein BD410DRAFT_782728 [Rickenella mellea]